MTLTHGCMMWGRCARQQEQLPHIYPQPQGAVVLIQYRGGNGVWTRVCVRECTSAWDTREEAVAEDTARRTQGKHARVPMC